MITPTERRLAITQGNCKFTARNNDALISAGNKVVAEVGRADLEGWDQVIANATLYVDAHNTANACDMLPSELLAQVTKLRSERDELVGALSEVVYQADEGMPIIDVSPCIVKASKLLAKHKTE